MSDPIKKFEQERRERIESYASNKNLIDSAKKFTEESVASGYTYNFSWMGRPIIQCPQDMIAMQEIIWETKPDLIIETGIAHGGSLIFYASILELIGNGSVLGIDIDIRAHNNEKILAHPMSSRIEMIQGSSTDPEIIKRVAEIASGKSSVMLCLDSNHTHEHVLNELNGYSDFVTVGNYIVIFDTIVEEMKADSYPNRPWGVGDNPMTAVKEFLAKSDQFVIDSQVENKIQITMSPGGYLKKIK